MKKKVIDFRGLYWLLWVLILVAGLAGIYLICQSQTEGTVKVEWSTASEIDSAGFNIYRSENLEGPYEKINTELIPASGDALTGRDYSFIDTNARRGKKYYYELEEVEFNGFASRYDPVQVSDSNTGTIEIIEYVLAGGVVIIGLAGLWRNMPGKIRVDRKPDER
jgi:hypothetical protein